MIGNYCRKYRLNKGATLIELTEGKQVKTLSAFEMGRSSNIHHLQPYINLSIKYSEELEFMNGLIKEIRGI